MNVDEDTEYDYDDMARYKDPYNYRNSLAFSDGTESTYRDDFSLSSEGASNYFTRGSLLGQRLLSFALSSRSVFDDYFKQDIEVMIDEEKIDVEDESHIDHSDESGAFDSVDFHAVDVFNTAHQRRQQQMIILTTKMMVSMSVMMAV